MWDYFQMTCLDAVFSMLTCCRFFCSNAFLIVRCRPIVSSHAVYLSLPPDEGKERRGKADWRFAAEPQSAFCGPWRRSGGQAPSPAVWLTWGDSAKAAADCQGASRRLARLRAAFVCRRRPLSSHNMCCCQGPERAQSAFWEKMLPANPLDALSHSALMSSFTIASGLVVFWSGRGCKRMTNSYEHCVWTSHAELKNSCDSAAANMKPVRCWLEIRQDCSHIVSWNYKQLAYRHSF